MGAEERHWDQPLIVRYSLVLVLRLGILNFVPLYNIIVDALPLAQQNLAAGVLSDL